MFEEMKGRWRCFIVDNESLGFFYNPSCDKTFADVYKKYTEPHRHYHDLSHVKNCLVVLQPFRRELNDRACWGAAIVESAIWFHDVIYNPQSGTNEEDSARISREYLANIGLCGGKADEVLFRAQVVRMILLTKHLGAASETPLSYEEELFLDIDLSILGAQPHVFQKYDDDIQKEYSWVPAEIYGPKRVEVLQNFLDREYIYLNPAMRNSYERQARENLSNALKKLKA